MQVEFYNQCFVGITNDTEYLGRVIDMIGLGFSSPIDWCVTPILGNYTGATQEKSEWQAFIS